MAQKLLHYEVLDRLGEGAKSTIYKVYDPLTGRTLALKHVVRKEDKDIRFIEQMASEFEVAKNFNHPVLRRCYDLKIVKTMIFKVTEAFLVMELVDGKPLDVALPRNLVALLDVFLQVSQGLSWIHRAGYVHCDIKPINILITDTGEVKVIDFGQSCRVGTTKDRIQGTPDYIAPEQVARKPVNAKTDIFNLGATMYWSLTNRTIPTLYTVSKTSDHSILAHELMQSPMEINPAVPEALSRLIMDCISTGPSKRPDSMEVVIQRLELVKYNILKQEGKVVMEPSAVVAPDLYEDEEV